MLVRLAMRTGRLDLARKELEALEAASERLQTEPQVRFAKAKLIWAEKDREGAIQALTGLVTDLAGRTAGVTLSKEHGSQNIGTLELCLEGGFNPNPNPNSNWISAWKEGTAPANRSFFSWPGAFRRRPAGS